MTRLMPAQVQEIEWFWEGADETVHEEGCWRRHPECAIARLIASHRDLEKELERKDCITEYADVKLMDLERQVHELTDICDLNNDEFLRIEALDASDEINGICSRALSSINKTVPVLQELKDSQAEATRLREQLNDAVCYILHGGQRPNLVDIQQALTGQEGEG